MISRRSFLGYSMAGALGAVAGCRPDFISQSTSSPRSKTIWTAFLDEKRGLGQRRNYFLGYPINMNTPPESFFTWREQLKGIGLGQFSFNNVGNPFEESSISNNTHDLERALILRFGQVYGFSPDDTWGFLSNSGTDSNMHGMYMGRVLLQGMYKKAPVCYFTREAHYSIQILGDLLGMEVVYVNTLPDAGMDPGDLRMKLSKYPNRPALVVATIGTTFKGAIDKVDEINEVLGDFPHYLHLDAALFGGYLPHITAASDMLLHTDKQAVKRYDSIAVSCHKFFGFSSPAGLFISIQSNFDRFRKYYGKVHNPEYIGHVPGTITCSRDAVKPAEFYYFSCASAMERQAADAESIMKHTTYLIQEMQTHLPDRMPRRSNDYSNTIYFRSPSKQIVKKYSLATMHLDLHGKKQEFAHVVIMPHVDKKILDEFLEDLMEEKALSRS